MAPVFGLLKDLQLGKSKFALQLRLIRSYEVPQFHNSKEVGTLECVFHDKEGNRVHATIQKMQIASFKNLLQEGNVYAVMKYIVGNNTMRMKTTTCNFKILMYKKTRISELLDDGFPTHVLNLKSFQEIQSMKSIQDLQAAPLFDVMGIIVSSYKPVEKVLNGKPTKLMDIMIEDLEQKILKCTLWEKYVEEVNDFLCNEPKEPVGIAIQFCRANIFRVRIANSYHATKIAFAGSVVEITEIQEKYMQLNKDKTTALKLIPAPIIRNIHDEIKDGESSFKTISKLSPNEDGKFWIYGTIFSVKSVGAWAYLACRICFKKLKKDDDKFYCETCKTFETSGRLRLRVEIADDSGVASFILWDRECLQLIGKTAEELSVECGSCDMPFDLSALDVKTALFKINARVDEIEMNNGAYMVTKVDINPEMMVKYSNESNNSKNEESSGTNTTSKANANTIESVDLSDDEQVNKRKSNESTPIIMKQRSKRIVIKQEKN